MGCSLSPPSLATCHAAQRRVWPRAEAHGPVLTCAGISSPWDIPYADTPIARGHDGPSGRLPSVVLNWTSDSERHCAALPPGTERVLNWTSDSERHCAALPPGTERARMRCWHSHARSRRCACGGSARVSFWGYMAVPLWAGDTVRLSSVGRSAVKRIVASGNVQLPADLRRCLREEGSFCFQQHGRHPSSRNVNG
jgi:hypothetical protein